MLTPATLPLLVRHLDAVDEALSQRTAWQWKEEALTELLCDLLNETRQPAYHLTYPFQALQADLAAAAPLVDARIRIESHQYDKNVESRLTQSDVGLVIEAIDTIAPGRSTTTAVLLQAKRANPNPRTGDHDTTSVFAGYSSRQEERIQRLRSLLGVDAVQHLLYCPRGGNLASVDGQVLAHLRTAGVARGIHDYTLGQAKLEELRNNPNAFDAGLFVAQDLVATTTLRDLHATAFAGATPLAWYIAQALSNHPHHDDEPRLPSTLDALLLGLVRGERAAVEAVRSSLELEPRNYTFAPSHTITITLTAGVELQQRSG